ncbi:MAG: alpha/beta fold hydrolase [bacterium]
MKSISFEDQLKTYGKTALIAGGVFGGIWALDTLMESVLKESDNYDDRYLLSTEDGHKVALYRYESAGETRNTPVLLVHGLSSNHRNLAMNDRDGLAQYLARQGYDCWAVELRGRVDEDSPDEPWGFDEYVQQDLPAAIKFIQTETESDTVHWIGHSMGGMAYLAYAGALDGSDDIQSGTSIGSPAILDEPAWIRVLGQCYFDIPHPVRALIDRPMREIFNTIFRSIPTRVIFLLIIEKEITLNGLRILANAIENGLDPRISLQFIEWISSEEWLDRGGTVDYRAGLENIESPTMTVVGRRDYLCPDCETAGFDLIGTEDKRCLVGTEASGTEWEFDHLSLVFGKRATDEIFPEIEDWLATHDD